MRPRFVLFLFSLGGLTFALGGASPVHAQCVGLQLPPVVRADPAASDRFGSAVSIEGSRALIGASNDDDHGADSGSAYVFAWQAPDWVQSAKLTASNGAANDKFGSAVALSGDTAVIGVPGRDSTNSDAGSIYVFDFAAGVGWSQLQELWPASLGGGSAFGTSVDIDGDTLVVGAPGQSGSRGAAYVYRRTAGVWGLEATLLASDGDPGDAFGTDVAISGGRIVVGAPFQDPGGWWQRGLAYIYERSGSVWAETAKPCDQIASAGFHIGTYVDLDGDTALIGSTSGAYLYSKTSGTWTEVWQTNTSIDGALHGSRLIGMNHDAAWHIQVVTCENGLQGWTTLSYHTLPTSASFASCIALEGDKFIVGVPDDSQGNPAAGAALPFWYTNLVSYCTPEATSIPGCLATLSTSGAPTLANPAALTIQSSPTPGGRPGVFFWGRTGPKFTPFQGGHICVDAPTRRSMVKFAGGTVGVCDGSYSLSGTEIAFADPHWTFGTQFNVQLWFRDPGSIGNSALSDAIAFVVCP
jgi:hypothetical protein